jgi:hypothetical protein
MKKIIASFLIFAGTVFAQRPVRPMFRYQIYPRPVPHIVQPRHLFEPAWPYMISLPVLGGIIGYEIGIRSWNGHTLECKDFPVTVVVNDIEQIGHVKQCRVDNGPWQIPSGN